MTLTKIRLGNYIEQSTENNSDLKYSANLIAGVTSAGVFSTPKVDVSNVNLKPYKIVNTGAFVYNPTRLDLGSIALRTDGLCIVSHLYMVFYLNEEGKKIIDPRYLYMYFRRKEFCREVTFRNFGSQRPEFNFKKMSDIVIPLPEISIQRKYADIYDAMLANQRSYEKGLEDLKIVFDGILDKEKFVSDKQPVKKLLEEVDERNEDGLLKDVLGINVNKEFMPSVANVKNIDLSRYKIVKSGQLAFSGMQTGRDQCIRIALNKSKNPILISPAYTVFKIKTKAVIAEYIMMWFSRAESDRKGWFMSDSSIRSNLDLERFYETQIPVPDLKRQHGVANIYSVYKERQHINEKLKEQIKKICPILIKGSLEEAGI